MPLTSPCFHGAASSAQRNRTERDTKERSLSEPNEQVSARTPASLSTQSPAFPAKVFDSVRVEKVRSFVRFDRFELNLFLVNHDEAIDWS